MAAVSGFGIGSLLTPLLAAHFGTKAAVAAVSIPHVVVVDGARLPIYVWTEWATLTRLWPQILVAIAGVLVGTLVGVRLLRRIPERVFRPSVSVLISALGVYMLLHG